MEPGNLAGSYWCSTDCANRLLEQTETLYTAAHRGRCDGGNGKNSLAGRVSPSGDLQTQLLRLDIRIELINHSDLYLWRPLSPIRYNYTRNQTKKHTPRRWEACDEPLIPHST